MDVIPRMCCINSRSVMMVRRQCTLCKGVVYIPNDHGAAYHIKTVPNLLIQSRKWRGVGVGVGGWGGGGCWGVGVGVGGGCWGGVGGVLGLGGCWGWGMGGDGSGGVEGGGGDCRVRISYQTTKCFITIWIQIIEMDSHGRRDVSYHRSLDCLLQSLSRPTSALSPKVWFNWCILSF